MFTETTLDHFQRPRNVGELPPPAVTVEVTNPACGDILRLAVAMVNGRVTETRYKIRGCTASIAAGSALTELMDQRTVAELAAIDANAIEAALGGLPPASSHAAHLCADAVKSLVKRIRG